MKIKVKSLLLLLLYIIVIGCENCFYLVNASAINVAGVMNYTDFFLILAIIFCVIVFHCYKNYPTPTYKFKWLILGIVLLSIISSIQSQRLYGQSIIIGLRPQRFWMVWGFLYFPLRKLLYIKKISVEDLIKMIFFIGTCEIILYSLQYLIGSSFLFLHVGTSVRYGGDRYYFSNIFLRILLFLNMDRLINRKKIFESSLYIVSIMFIILVVGKMRMTTLSTSLSMMFGLFIWRKGGKTKVVYILFAGIIGLLLFNSNIVQDALTVIFETDAGTSTLGIRQLGRELYIESLVRHPILGCGFISILNDNAAKAAGLDRSILLVDNGLWAFIFMYGILGAIWVFEMFSIFIRNGWRIIKTNNLFFIFLVPLEWLIASQTDALWYWDGGFICVTLILSIMEEFITNSEKRLSTILQ